MNAIIVPSFRKAPFLDHAIRLAEELRCPLVVLCSGLAKGREVMTRALRHKAVVVAINVAELRPRLPALATSKLLKGGPFERRTDTSFKRNLGLSIARSAGWQRIVFLDDDITVRAASDLRHAAGLAGTCDIVGLANDGFPDNSVVCHANRRAGERKQDTFIGGGAMVLDPFRTTSFFPKIYNEDWFFLLDEDRLGSVGMFGTMTQKAYDPFAYPIRAIGEEFGDCLAEGIYSVLDQGGKVTEAEDEAFWRTFLRARGQLIDDVLRRVRTTRIRPAVKQRMVAALNAAQSQRALIEPSLCVKYLQAWRSDREIWSAHLDRLGRQRCLCAALHEVGVLDRAIHGALPFQPTIGCTDFGDCGGRRVGTWAHGYRRSRKDLSIAAV